MIPIVINLMPPSGVMLAKSAPAVDGAPSLLEQTGEMVLEHFRQAKADWGGQPDIAEQIFQIVSSTISR